jgi:glycosyltransferase involved in cell wall biosynthesis
MRSLAVVFAGDSRDPALFSGIPAGLTAALERAGVEVERINASFPRVITRALNQLPYLHPERCRLQSVIAQRALAKSRAEGILQIGSEYVIRAPVPTITYDDMTVVQHATLRDEWFTSFPPRARAAWQARQTTIYRRAVLCCVLSQWAGESIVSDYGVARENIRVVGLGCNHTEDTINQSRDWSSPRYLCVAVDWRRKNVPLTVEAFGTIRREYPSATLDIVGPYPGPGGPGVTLHGTLSLRDPDGRQRVSALFRNSTCYVMPSKHEASALVFVEAGMAGIPSIGTKVGGVGELIGPGGLVVDPLDPRAITDAMRKFADPATAQEFGRRALQHARWYTWDNVAERVVSAFGEARRLEGPI